MAALKQQQGTALIISLLLLLIITMAGISSISSAILEEKLASNYRDQQIAFQAAEAALVEAESLLLTHPLSSESGLNNCQDDLCFTTACYQGLCRTVDYDKDGTCTLGHDRPWERAVLWQDPGHHRRSTKLPQLAQASRYIIEFRCFHPNDITPAPASQQNTDSEIEQEQRSPLYRITVLATGGSKTARVMLQSTLQLPAEDKANGINSELEASAPANQFDEGAAEQELQEISKAEELFLLRPRQRRSWQQLEVNF